MKPTSSLLSAMAVSCRGVSISEIRSMTRGRSLRKASMADDSRPENAAEAT